MSFTPPDHMPKAPPRCGCMDKTHGHVVPCFHPRLRGHELCLGCEKGTTCTKDHFDKLGICWHCKCELAKNPGDLEEHAPDCPMFPL